MKMQCLGRRAAVSGGVAAVAAAVADCQPALSQTLSSAQPAPEDEAGKPSPGLEDARDASSHAPFRAAFLAWFDEASARFGLPVSVDLASPFFIELRVHGLHPAIWIVLTQDWSIDVGVEWDGVFWDVLVSMDVAPEPLPDGGWENVTLIPEARISHPTPEAIWRADGFEELLTWINGELAPATHVGMWRVSGGGCTWARLMCDGANLRTDRPLAPEDAPDHLLALHGHACKTDCLPR